MIRDFLRPTGLRARLFAVVLIAAVPLALLLFTYVSIQNRAAEDRARAEVRDRLQADTQLLRDVISGGRATLVTFGITFAIQSERWDLAQGNAVRLKAENPDYALIAAADASGRIRASSMRGFLGADVSSEEFFTRAVQAREMVVSDYYVDPATGEPAISVVLPVYNAANELVAVEYIAFEQEQFSRRLTSSGGRSVETLIDGNGTVVARQPVAEGLVGKDMRDTQLVRTVLAEERGSATIEGLDGVMRDYYFAPVIEGEDDGLFLVAGFSAEELLAPQRRALVLTLVGFGVFTAVALVAAGLVGTYSVYRPARQLESAARHIAEGDLGTRIDLGGRRDELGELGRQFNRMAESLDSHVHELTDARAELRALNLDLEERVRRRTAELEAANEEMEAFSYSVSHDLRSPLRAIDGFSLALLEDYSDVLDEQGLSDLKRVRQNAVRMGELIDSLLRLSRLSRQDMKLAEVDLSTIAAELAESLRELDPGRSATFKIQGDVRGRGDASLLRIVLENLLGNAWKFTGKNEHATIEFGAVQSEAGETQYFVRDDGAGFDMAYAEKLFGAFQRVHGQKEFPGIGIGLATTARIIHRHGGRVWAQGEPGKGATFWFTLS